MSHLAAAAADHPHRGARKPHDSEGLYFALKEKSESPQDRLKLRVGRGVRSIESGCAVGDGQLIASIGKVLYYLRCAVK